MPKYIELLYGGHSSSTENDGYEVPRTNMQLNEKLVNSDMAKGALSETTDNSKKDSENASVIMDTEPFENSSKVKSTANPNTINASEC